MLTELIQEYQDYNPASGEHDCPRSLREYARLLGVDHSTLVTIYSGYRNPGGKVIRGLLRAFPDKRQEITEAIAAETTQVA